MKLQAALIVSVLTLAASWHASGEPGRQERRRDPDFDFDFELDLGELDLPDGATARELSRIGPRIAERLRGLEERLQKDLGPLASLSARERGGGDEDDRGDDAGDRESLQEERRELERARQELQRLREEGRLRRELRSKEDGEPAGPEVAGSSARIAVQGKITFTVRSHAASIELVAGKAGEVQLTLTGVRKTGVTLASHGDRVEAQFDGRPSLRRGKLRVELPPGSHVDLQSMAGDLVVKGVGGDVRVRSLSGDVSVAGCASADVQSVSGDVRVEAASGAVRVQTVSGNSTVTSSGGAPQLTFGSTSGSLDWAGVCGKGCRLSTETISGDVKLKVARGSSFAVSFASHSGKLERGGLDLSVKRESRRRKWAGGLTEAVFGSGEGVIESDAFSGDLRFDQK